MTEPNDNSEQAAISKWNPAASLGHPEQLGYALTSNQALGALNSAWPGDLNPDRREHKTKQLMKQAVIAIQGSQAKDKLCRCVGLSILDSLVSTAAMDLSLDKAFGEAYLVPFASVCTLMVGYRGFIKLLVNTGFVTHVESVLVYEGEKFEYWRDEKGPHWKHVPDVTLQGQASKVKAAYAVGYTKDGVPIFEVMNIAELEKVRAVSKAKNGPYTAWTTEMYRKAPIRRLQKYVPKTADNLGFELLAAAAAHDNEMYDLNGRAKYVEAHEQHQLEVQQAKSEEWERRVSGEPPTTQIVHDDVEVPDEPAAADAEKPAESAEKPAPDPNDPSTWEIADDGQPIPPVIDEKGGK